MNILVTGSCGFIGYHLCQRLLRKNLSVFGIDNLNAYYDQNLKRDRLKALSEKDNFKFIEMDLIDKDGLSRVFMQESFDHVVHLAAQAGVRYSITNPQAYVDSNVTGLLNALEVCKEAKIRHFVFASTSSVYGLSTKMPFSPQQGANHPLSLYATTKRAGELMGHNYASLWGMPFTAVRFFTVYGPWGRPDMALFLFTRKILEQSPIDVFNQGDHLRDFTYVDDIVDGLERILTGRQCQIKLGMPVWPILRLVALPSKFTISEVAIQSVLTFTLRLLRRS